MRPLCLSHLVVASQRSRSLHPFFHLARTISSLLVLSLIPIATLAIGQKRYIDDSHHDGDFPLVAQNNPAALYVDFNDYLGVIRAAGDLQSDIERVTSRKPKMLNDDRALPPNIVIIGTLGKSPFLDKLVREHKLDVSEIVGKWESFLIQVVSSPVPGVSNALVIAGSDKRGTIFGVYDLSEQIGVSPWYWWADVSVHHHNELFVKPGAYLQGPPAVKYRGIFLNDEAPALTGWVKEKYGSYNHEFYVKVFELILRLKGNYLWPAMWGSAFNEDDPLNPKLADEYGIVMGTTHHEPMMRAQQEWKRHGTGPWDYSKNEEVLKNFWTGGVENNKNFENIITLGMRGDGDMPMTESANIALLEKIVADQRKIIADHVNPDVTKVPQDWALYKEVQEYYEKGMRVPDDVTLLWCDDNWGNIRRLPTPDERKRRGGAGIYYHFDYVGDPRSYKWINTNPIPKVWEQMNLAYHYGADRIWIVNVGDLKPMEFPIEYFLNLAWRPENWPKERIGEFTRLWAEREFGPQYASEIADIISKFTKYNGRRKPELLEPGTYSQINYREAESVAAEFQKITDEAEKIYRKLPEDERDAFFELVLHPTKAASIVTQLYVLAGQNQLYASQGRASTNDLAAWVRALFRADADLSAQYNHTLAHGKWNHMMDQTHIGYTFWNEPPQNNMPVVKELVLPDAPELGVAIDGSASAWPDSSDEPILPAFDSVSRQTSYIDIFNRGRGSFAFTARPNAPWIRLSRSEGTVEKESRLQVLIDWSKVPFGNSNGEIQIKAGDKIVTVKLKAFLPQEPTRQTLDGFVESNGYVSMEAVHYSKKYDRPSVRWEPIDDLGRTFSSMSIFPVTAASVQPGIESPSLEYKMFLFDTGTVNVEAILSPTLNFVPGRGLRYAVAFDDETPQIIDALAHNSVADWSESVKDSVRKVTSTHTIAKPGPHVLKFSMVDPGVVLQKLIVNFGGEKPSYLGPPESFRGTGSAISAK
jgi:Glycosyl hydrolase family 115/Gylcosyl hydrolase family 115 C-terminal domain